MNEVQSLTARQRREREFYESYAKHAEPEEITLDPVVSPQRRPWNSYWYAYDIAADRRRRGAHTLLDFGCGTGIASIRCAQLGYDVHGFDIAPSNVERATELARKYGCESNTHFSVQVAESLKYPDQTFDVVMGFDILHHVDIGPAVRESMRVLKPGGVAIFREWVEVPVLDRIRRSAIVRRLVPNDPSDDHDHHITEDERKLNESDLEIIRNTCGRTTAKRFMFLSRLDRFLRPRKATWPSRLEQLDEKLLRIRFLETSGGAIVLVLENSARDEGNAPGIEAGLSRSA